MTTDAFTYGMKNTATLTTVDCSTTPSQHVWSSGFLRCGSDGMELASTLTPGPCS